MLKYTLKSALCKHAELSRFQIVTLWTFVCFPVLLPSFFIDLWCVPNGIYRPLKGTSEWKQSWRHIEVSFQTEVLKISHFKRPFGMKDFEGYNWWTLRAPMILCMMTAPPYDDAEGHFKKQMFGPLHPSKLSLRKA